MAVNLRKRYIGNEKLNKRNRPYRFQLDYVLNGKRVREMVKDITFEPTDTKEEKKQKDRIVHRIKSQLEIELGNSKNGLVSRHLQKSSFIDYFKKLTEKKSTNTKVAWGNTLKHIIKFNGNKLTFEDVSENWLEKFLEYLENHLATNSVLTYYNKVNATLNQAVKDKIIIENPSKYIHRPRKEEKEMSFLNETEIQEIINTYFYNSDIKNAFLFSCYTGLRYSDIKALKWKNIVDQKVQLTQSKTKAVVYIPLNKNALQILEKQNKNQEYVFYLFDSNSSVNRTFRKLINKTSIKKNISFHSGRHTFATLLISSGANLFTVSKLLGHRDIKSTQVYAKVINEEKERAVHSMPNFNF